MSSEPVWLLRRPLAPKGFPHIVKTCPAPRRSGAAVRSLRNVKDTDRGVSRRQGVTFPRIAPPTPLLTDAPVVTKVIEGFPCKPPRTLPKIPLLQVLHTDPRFLPPPPSFSLNDFLLSQDGVRHRPQSPLGLRKVALSRCNYKKLVGLFLMELHRGEQTEVSRQVIGTGGLPEVRSRIPDRQLLCELAALIRMEVQALVMIRRSSLQSPTPRSEVEVWLPPGPPVYPGSVCDCCRGPLFGPGLQVKRPCYNIFGPCRVSFIFNP